MHEALSLVICFSKVNIVFFENPCVPWGSLRVNIRSYVILIYIIDIVKGLRCNIRFFVDDTSLYVIVETPVTAALQLNTDFYLIKKWADRESTVAQW